MTKKYYINFKTIETFFLIMVFKKYEYNFLNNLNIYDLLNNIYENFIKFKIIFPF